MSRSFNQYTDAELLALDNDTINDAIRIEAIERGIEPPIVLSEAIRKSEWRGYIKPNEAIEVFELCNTSRHGELKASGIGYLDKAKVEAALDGLIAIEDDRYSKSPGTKIHQGTAQVISRSVGTSQSDQAWAKLEEFTQDNTKFNEVSDECIARLSKVRQEDYTKRVNAEKKAEFLRLAGGDESIAKGFWAKVERTEWPA